MIDFEAVYWIFKREILRFIRDRFRVISSLIQPTLFLIVLGGGFSFLTIENINYQNFLFPGIVAISLVGVSIATGISVIWDREFGILKEILVAPVSRFSIFLGKAVSGCTIALFQGLIVIMIGFVIGISMTLEALLFSMIIMVFISLGLVSIGLIISSFVETIESFGVVMNFLVFPLTFLSGAFYPLSQAPKWLKTISLINPLTYGVDALRHVIIKTSYLPFHLSFSFVVLFSTITLIFGSIVFSRQR